MLNEFNWHKKEVKSPRLQSKGITQAVGEALGAEGTVNRISQMFLLDYIQVSAVATGIGRPGSYSTRIYRPLPCEFTVKGGIDDGLSEYPKSPRGYPMHQTGLS